MTVSSAVRFELLILLFFKEPLSKNTELHHLLNVMALFLLSLLCNAPRSSTHLQESSTSSGYVLPGTFSVPVLLWGAEYQVRLKKSKAVRQ